MNNDTFWHNHFYPNVADGENEYYGNGQDDYGAGAPILDEVDLDASAEVEIHTNRGEDCEYYARITEGDFTVHLIQLHFSDQPSDTSFSFNSDSRQYLIETLNSIDKDEHDIIIACAHSRSGHWVDLLDEDRREAVMEKADLVLSATTHKYERQLVEGYGAEDGALCLNTGSITHANSGPDGYL